MRDMSGHVPQVRHRTFSQGVHSMRCFVWQDNMLLMSNFVRNAMRMVRAASSGDELDVQSAKLAGTFRCNYLLLLLTHAMLS